MALTKKYVTNKFPLEYNEKGDFFMFRFKRRRLSGKQKFVILFLIILIIIFVVLLFIQTNINPIIVNISEAKVRAMTTSAINDAVFSCLDDSIKYTDLIEITVDSQGKIEMLQANSMKINEIARKTAKVSQSNLDAMLDAGINVPLGTLTGSPMLAEEGPDIHIEIMPVGSALCKFISEFESAGINQTRHKIFLEVVTNVNLIIPVSTASLQIKTQVLICESILVGDVPKVYLELGGSNDILDLVP